MSHSFNRIPPEMHFYRQWIVWRLEDTGGPKPDKVPYSPLFNGKASVTQPSSWASFDEAVAEFESDKGYAGIGFILTKDDPFCFLDFDDTQGDAELQAWHREVHDKFNSYSEWSPSGTGIHVIAKGSVPRGRRRSKMEIYSDVRFMTMTGNVYNDMPIREANTELNILWNEMGGPAEIAIYGGDDIQREDDNSIINRMFTAINGDKAKDLFEGRWQEYFPHSVGASEADFALIDIIAFYTQNRAQVKRIFGYSELGKREKYSKRPQLVEHMTNRSFDNQLPPVDIDGLLIQLKNIQAEALAQSEIEICNEASAEGLHTDAPALSLDRADKLADDAVMPTGSAVGNSKSAVVYPPGLIGEIAEYVYAVAPRPVREIALAAAIGFIAGITGRSYNVSGTGLNQYIMLLAPTGTGKEAINRGISKLVASLNANSNGTDYASKFIGPGEIRSDAALLKWLAKEPCFVTVSGEFGLRLKRMNAERGAPHEVALKAVMLDLYSKSGAGEVLNAMAYSDKDKTVPAVHSPSFTLIGESTPERFYEALDESMVYEGLLPRFTMIEYTGPRPELNENHAWVMPSPELIQKLSQLLTHIAQMTHDKKVTTVAFTPEGKATFDRFNRYCDDCINGTESRELHRHMWSRAHVKAMKLAASVAVGLDISNPIIDHNCAMWATGMIVTDVERIIDKFERGDVGNRLNGNEGQQFNDLVKWIGKALTGPASDCTKYGLPEQMHKDGVILASAITKKFFHMASFKTDRIGATNAIKRTLQHLLDGDELREVPKAQMREKYGVEARAFVISRPATFV